jgi:hypothetical protein
MALFRKDRIWFFEQSCFEEEGQTSKIFYHQSCFRLGRE